MIGKVEVRSIMQNVAVPTLLLTSPEYLLTSAQARGWHLALLAHCTREENGGRIVGAAPWSADRWLLVLGKGGTREAADAVVADGLAEWAGDDLIVASYATELERSYQRIREAGKKGALLKQKRRAAKLAHGEEPDGERGASPPSSPPDTPPSSPPDGEPVGLGKARSGDVGQGDVSDSAAGGGRAPRREAPPSGSSTPADPTQADPSASRAREAERVERPRDPDAPDPAATLAHYLRARQGTKATAAEERAFNAYCDSLPPAKKQSAQEQIWDYWRADKSPTVTTWLARQHGIRR